MEEEEARGMVKSYRIHSLITAETKASTPNLTAVSVDIHCSIDVQ